jgi:hypothetical protein
VTGQVTLKSRAVDSSGNQQDPPTEVTVTVAAPDTTRPQVSSISPLAGADDVSVNANVTATFNEAMDAATVNTSTIELRNPSNDLITATVSYDAASFTATLDPDAPLAAETTYTVKIRGGDTDPRVKDVAGNALSSNFIWTFKTVPPPLVVSTTPANGDSDVPVNIAPTARFSSALNPTTVNADTVLLFDSGNNQVPVTVSYEPSALTVALVPATPLQPGQMYTARLVGGSTAPRIEDTMGQPLPATVAFSFMTALAGSGPATFTVFTNQIPEIPAIDDGVSIELGLKFRANEDGLVTGVRFYKGGASNTDPPIGHLWDITGAPLGSVTFTNETASGWQTALFPAPIAITAGTTYVVSYLAPQGRYSATNLTFATDGVDNGPLHALSHIEAGGNPGGNLDGNGNGVFSSNPPDPEVGFPTNSFRASNYFVDVVFAPAPQVLSVAPAPGAANVPISFQPTATFSEALNDLTVNDSTVLLRTAGNVTVPATISYDQTTFTIKIMPQQDLQPGRAYTVILKGGASNITDSTGTPLSADYIWSFTTAP